MLSPTQMFLKLFFVFAIGEAILFAMTVYFFDMSKQQMIGLGVVAVIILIIFAIRTWNNPEIHR